MFFFLFLYDFVITLLPSPQLCSVDVFPPCISTRPEHKKNQTNMGALSSPPMCWIDKTVNVPDCVWINTFPLSPPVGFCFLFLFFFLFSYAMYAVFKRPFTVLRPSTLRVPHVSCYSCLLLSPFFVKSFDKHTQGMRCWFRVSLWWNVFTKTDRDPHCFLGFFCMCGCECECVPRSPPLCLSTMSSLSPRLAECGRNK